MNSGKVRFVGSRDLWHGSNSNDGSEIGFQGIESLSSLGSLPGYYY
jgi:hypothetical protein